MQRLEREKEKIVFSVHFKKKFILDFHCLKWGKDFYNKQRTKLNFNYHWHLSTGSVEF